METKKLKIIINDVSVSLFAFDGGQGVREYLAMLTCTNPEQSFEEQARAMADSCEEIRTSNFHGHLGKLSEAHPVFKRYYLSDAANQLETLQKIIGEQDCAVSYVQQPPLQGAKLGLWVYLMAGTENHKIDDNMFAVTHNGYTELWSAQLMAAGKNAFDQTFDIMTTYAQRLRNLGCTLADNCLRTWLYVNDIDNHYDGVVKGRNAVFDTEHLTDDTHFIASTGIGGRCADHQVLCMMNAYAIKGIKPNDVRHLYALDHLNRTSDYGVRFERGSYIDFAGRRKVFISGTASIDNKGDIMHVGDIRQQVRRMWENIQALLAEGGCTFDDVAEMTVYLRDTADYKVVSDMFAQKFPDTPYIIVLAPVCRPGWLVETECLALKKL